MTKEFIIKEIKRTAVDGKALGTREFARKTGIESNVWQGKIWARWGDAIKEAGFERNELTPAFESSFMLEQFAKLALKLGKLPSSMDMRMEKRTNLPFPNDKAYSRFGSRDQLVSELKVFCEAKAKYLEVVRMCDEYVTPRTMRSKAVIATVENTGFVYMIKSGRYFKIGRANSAGRRSYELAIQLPDKIAPVHVIKTDDPIGVEKYWHERFEQKRKNGEWFDLESSDIVAFKKWKKIF